MLDRVIMWLSGGVPLADQLSDDQLIELFQQMGSVHAPAELGRVRRRERSLIGCCFELLSKGRTQSDEQFFRGAYVGLLGREPDEGGFTGYVGNLKSGSIGRAEVIESILHSQELRQRARVQNSISNATAVRAGRLRAYASDSLLRMMYPDLMLPPLSMRHRIGENIWDVSGRSFEMTGWHFVEKLSRDACLGAGTRMLDLGSGCGRIAIPLTEVVSPPGLYWGIEPVKPMVRWCQRKITPRFPHFRFLHFDVRNVVYNPRGREKAETLRFPFDANTFDLIVATSIFTHLLPQATLNYIRECGRVLRDGATLFATFFLSESGTRSADWELNFAHRVGGIALSIDPVLPESALAYPTDWILDSFRQSSLQLLPPVRWGTWSGRARGYSGQDVLIFRKQ